MPEGKRLVGNSGYIGEPTMISTTLGGHSAEVKELFGRFKSRQESLFHGYKALDKMVGHAFCNKGLHKGGEQMSKWLYMEGF